MTKKKLIFTSHMPHSRPTNARLHLDRKSLFSLFLAPRPQVARVNIFNGEGHERVEIGWLNWRFFLIAFLLHFQLTRSFHLWDKCSKTLREGQCKWRQVFVAELQSIRWWFWQQHDWVIVNLRHDTVTKLPVSLISHWVGRLISQKSMSWAIFSLLFFVSNSLCVCSVWLWKMECSNAPRADLKHNINTSGTR